MADPYVRQISFVEDIDGIPLDDIPAGYDGAPLDGYVSDPAGTSGPDGI